MRYISPLYFLHYHYVIYTKKLISPLTRKSTYKFGQRHMHSQSPVERYEFVQFRGVHRLLRGATKFSFVVFVGLSSACIGDHIDRNDSVKQKIA